MLIDSTPGTWPPAEAVALAEVLNENEKGDDDGWTYRAINPTGELGPASRIEVTDENGEIVGHLPRH